MTSFYRVMGDHSPHSVSHPLSSLNAAACKSDNRSEAASQGSTHRHADGASKTHKDLHTMVPWIPASENTTTTKLSVHHHAPTAREIHPHAKTPVPTPVATTLAVEDLDEQTHNEKSGQSARETLTMAKHSHKKRARKHQSVTVTEEDMERFEMAFRLFDHDDEGVITCGELGRVMRSLGMEPTVDELHYMITAADLNGTGTVEFEEFVQMLKHYIEKHHEEEDEDALLRKVFEVFDRSSDGYISGIELKSVMRQLGEELTEEELNSMLNLADTNGDGTVTFAEFRRICVGDLSKMPGI